MRIRMGRPDDFHVHFRDDGAMRSVVPYTARQFGRALAMPNTKPPVVNTEQAILYQERIHAAAQRSDFRALMCLYLTDNTDPEEMFIAKESGVVVACNCILPEPLPILTQA